jgi:hypothetical protein
LQLIFELDGTQGEPALMIKRGPDRTVRALTTPMVLTATDATRRVASTDGIEAGEWSSIASANEQREGAPAW